MNIPKKSHQDYRTVLNGAYYTYSTHDEIFKTEMDGVLQLYNSIYQLILSKALIDELKLDPMTMDETLFNEFYKRLEQKYIKGLTLPSLI